MTGLRGSAIWFLPACDAFDLIGEQVQHAARFPVRAAVGQFLDAIGDADFQKGPAVVWRGAADELFPFGFQILDRHGLQGGQAGQDGLINRWIQTRLYGRYLIVVLHQFLRCGYVLHDDHRSFGARSPRNCLRLSADKELDFVGVQANDAGSQNAAEFFEARVALTCAQDKEDWDPKSGLM